MNLVVNNIAVPKIMVWLSRYRILKKVIINFVLKIKITTNLVRIYVIPLIIYYDTPIFYLNYFKFKFLFCVHDLKMFNVHVINENLKIIQV